MKALYMLAAYRTRIKKRAALQYPALQGQRSAPETLPLYTSLQRQYLYREYSAEYLHMAATHCHAAAPDVPWAGKIVDHG